MQDYRLNFSDEAAWWAAADAQGWVQYEYAPPENPDDPPVAIGKTLCAPSIDFDVIGVMYQDQPITDPENSPAPVPLPGWHVNVRFRDSNLPPAMNSNIVMPSNPRRTFAGGWFQGTPE